MNQQDQNLLKTMNIDSDLIVINQNMPLQQSSFEYHGNRIDWYNFPERGVGKSRNMALSYASGDIILFSDDDVQYRCGYKEKIIYEFEKNTDADMIIFNVLSNSKERPEYIIKKNYRVHLFNSLRYGTFRIAIRLERLRKERIYFSQLFGGGSRYGSGEDSLFIVDCLKRGMHIYASPVVIGEVSHEISTWFDGYSEKYFYDKGALYCGISKYFAPLFCLRYCLRYIDTTKKLSFPRAYRCMLNGIDDYKRRK